MNVADLQQHLADLSRLLEASGAKGVATDLAAIRDGLQPFRAHPLKMFAEFLIRAETYSRGEVPVIPPRGGRTKAKPPPVRASKAPAADLALLVRESQELYERVADPSVTEEQIDALVTRLKGLGKEALVTVADAIDLKGTGRKKKDDIIAAIRQRMIARKGASQRAGLIDRPAPGVTEAEMLMHP